MYYALSIPLRRIADNLYRVTENEIDHAFLIVPLFPAKHVPIFVRLSVLEDLWRNIYVAPRDQLVHHEGVLVIDFYIYLHNSRRQTAKIIKETTGVTASNVQ